MVPFFYRKECYMVINKQLAIKMFTAINSKLEQGKRLSKNEIKLLTSLISFTISDLSDIND